MRFLAFTLLLLTGCASRGIIGLSSEGVMKDDGKVEVRAKAEVKITF